MNEELDQNDPKAMELRQKRFELGSTHFDSLRYARFLMKALNLAERRARAADELTLAATYRTLSGQAETIVHAIEKQLLPKP